MDVFEVFKKNDIKQAIVSAKTHKQYEIDICSKGIDQYMDTVILAEDPSMKVMEELKIKDPEPLLKCIENLNVPKEEVIYIGDALSDQQSSINAGIDFGYAKWGSVSTSPLHGTYTFESPIDLLKLL